MLTEPQASTRTSYLNRLHQDLLSLRNEVEEKTADLTEAQWNWTPSRDRWSLAQILDHLNRVGYGVAPHFEEAILELKRRNARSDGPFRYNGFERFTIRLLSPNPPFKLPVPPLFNPVIPQNPARTVLPEFLTLQDRLLAILEAANGYDLTAVKVTSPANRFFRLRLGAYLESTVTHEQYHQGQLRELLTHPNFPAR